MAECTFSEMTADKSTLTAECSDDVEMGLYFLKQTVNSIEFIIVIVNKNAIIPQFWKQMVTQNQIRSTDQQTMILAGRRNTFHMNANTVVTIYVILSQLVVVSLFLMVTFILVLDYIVCMVTCLYIVIYFKYHILPWKIACNILDEE